MTQSEGKRTLTSPIKTTCFAKQERVGIPVLLDLRFRSSVEWKTSDFLAHPVTFKFKNMHARFTSLHCPNRFFQCLCVLLECRVLNSCLNLRKLHTWNSALRTVLFSFSIICTTPQLQLSLSSMIHESVAQLVLERFDQRSVFTSLSSG